MKNDEIRSANRKALPKFIAAMAIFLMVGFAIGFFASAYGLDTVADSLKRAGAFFGMYIAPWLAVALALILPMICVPIYRSAKKLIHAWDGEDEDISGAIDRKLSFVAWLTGVFLILSYFLMAASYSKGFSILENKSLTALYFASIAAFIAVIIEVLIFGQKCVDAAKQINPEKKASIYDMKFQKKWLEDCDEAEKLLIGQCAFKAYSATNKVCAVLAGILAVSALLFNIGFLPSLVVCLIWIINHSVYCTEAIRYSKAGNKIS